MEVRSESDLPLCVDLDGTLIRTDTFVEGALRLVKRRPFDLTKLLWMILIHGRAPAKRWLFTRVQLRVDLLPYCEQVLKAIRQARLDRRTVYLVTGADTAVGEAVANHLQLFDGVFGSDAKTNLTGRSKRRLIVSRFGEMGFEYIGNSRSDIPVWEASARPILAHAGSLDQKLTKLRPESLVLCKSTGCFKWIVSSMRVHQWVKNLLLLLPLMASHRVMEFELLKNSIVGLVSFSLAASGLYIANDLFDLDSDRQHPVKRHRPFASGNGSPLSGIAIGIVLISSSLAIAWFQPNQFFWVIVSYLSITVGYTLFLKRLVFLDTITLSMLFTLRVIGGYEATGLVYSSWLLALSMFLFLSLALLKRFTEILSLVETEKVSTSGRGYHISDLSLTQTFGVVSGYMAALVLSLYIDSSRALEQYKSPFLLWLWCPLYLYYISRIWIIAGRGEMDSDPILFTLKDRTTYVILFLAFLVFLGAIFSPFSGA